MKRLRSVVAAVFVHEMKTLVRFFAILPVVAAAVLFLLTPLYAALIAASEDATKFGNLDQANTNCPNMSCGPTAAVNSFVFLQNNYPTIYTNPLVPTPNSPIPAHPSQTDMAAVANDLAGPTYMGTCSCGGTLIEDFILGKQAYIESTDPGSTIYAAQMNFAWRTNQNHFGAAKPGYVQDNTIPTVNFIANEIAAGEDVEAPSLSITLATT